MFKFIPSFSQGFPPGTKVYYCANSPSPSKERPFIRVLAYYYLSLSFGTCGYLRYDYVRIAMELLLYSIGIRASCIYGNFP